MTPLPQAPRDICNLCDTDPCICIDLRSYAEAQRLRAASGGLRYAQLGDFQRGLLALREALTLGMREAWVYEAAGLCALATGDVAGARGSWEAAAKLDGVSPALAWLSSLKSGSMRLALEAYDIALNSALECKYQMANAKLVTTFELLPDFIPARRLREILSRTDFGTGGSALPRAAWPSRTTVSRVLGGLAAASLVAVSLLLYKSVRAERKQQQSVSMPSASAGDKQVTVTPNVVHPTSANTSLDISAAVSLAFGDNPDSLAASIIRAGIDTVAWSVGVRQRATAFRVQIARRHFRQALHARSAGLERTAVREFANVAELGVDTYLEDDGLYELARSQTAVGAHGAASVTARHLLDAYPRSIYANSITKTMAANATGNARN